jgi:membrane-bound inhibitor of C-type lysozyme
MNRSQPIAAAGLAGALALLPAAQAAESELAIRAAYRCLGRFDAVDVTALFFNRPPAAVVLLVGETATRLPQAPAASGARYADGNQSFWIKGDQASWSIGGGPPMRCGPTPEPRR